MRNRLQANKITTHTLTLNRLICCLFKLNKINWCSLWTAQRSILLTKPVQYSQYRQTDWLLQPCDGTGTGVFKKILKKYKICKRSRDPKRRVSDFFSFLLLLLFFFYNQIISLCLINTDRPLVLVHFFCFNFLYFNRIIKLGINKPEVSIVIPKNSSPGQWESSSSVNNSDLRSPVYLFIISFLDTIPCPAAIKINKFNLI